MKAISPVIATVIIVSVAIAISIAVALWLTGITSGFTQTENLQIVSSYAEPAINITINTTVKSNYIANISLGSQWINLTENNITNYHIQIVKNVTNATGWVIFLDVKNTGTTTATIDNIFINNIPISSQPGVLLYNGTKTTINQGKHAKIIIVLQSGKYFSAGQMINIKIHSASGRDYPVTVKLP